MDMFVNDMNSGGDHRNDAGDSEDIEMILEEAGDEAGEMSGIVTSLTMDNNGDYQLCSQNGEGGVTYHIIKVAPSDSHEVQDVAGATGNDNSILSNLMNESRSASHASGSRLTASSAASSGLASRPEIKFITKTEDSPESFYVMMTPSDQNSAQSGQRTLIPRFTTGTIKTEGRVTRDDRKRATHNAVERRRRDKINTWITQLGTLLPDFTAEQSRQGDSKGGILSKAIEYIEELQSMNSQIAESLKESDKLVSDDEIIRRQYEELKEENEFLRAELQRRGIVLN